MLACQRRSVQGSMRPTKYTKELLEPLVQTSQTFAEVIRKLGLPTTGGNHRNISMRIRKAGLDTSHFGNKTIRGRIDAIAPAQLEALARESKSLAQMLDSLGFANMGRAHHELTRRLDELAIDTSHFTGAAWSAGLTKETHPALKRQSERQRYSDSVVFVENSPLYQGNGLIPRLLEKGWPYCCAWCGVSEWRGRKLVLHLDHINGIHNDNRLENLRLLCPNCHSQTDTYSNRRRPQPSTAGEACYMFGARKRAWWNW
jgi:hypothetical protein